MKNIITTTTNNIEGWTIKEYLQPISSNIVVGANIFSDLSASITDFFGGRSSSYEKKLQQIYDQSILNLQNKAKSLNANAILGLKIDIDEVSGKGSQMFMITAYGTPAKVAKIDLEKLNANQQSDSVIDGTYISKKVTAKRIIEKASQNIDLTDSEIDFIAENSFPELTDTVLALIKKYAESVGAGYDAEKETSNLNKLTTFFSKIDQKQIVEFIYNELLDKNNKTKMLSVILDIVRSYDLIDYDQVLRLLNSGELRAGKVACNIVSMDKQYYDQTDIEKLKVLEESIGKSFPPVGKVTKKKGFMSGEKDVWECSCNHTNNVDQEHCMGCGSDIYGFKRGEIKPREAINIIRDRLSFL